MIATELTMIDYTAIGIGISFIMLVGSLFTWKVMYDKAVRDRVTRKEFDDHKKDSKEYIDDKTRVLHHRVNGIEKRLDDGISDLQKDVKDILKLLSK